MLLKRALSFVIRKLIPNEFLNKLFPKKFPKHIFNNFINVEDVIGKKPFKLFLRYDSFMESVIFYKGLYGEWEKESLKIWAELSKSAKTIIDIGANTGIFSLLAYNNNPDSTIIAIEPVPINFEILKKNIRKNKFKIIAENIALSDKDGSAKMFMLKDRLNYMTSVNDDRYAIHPEIKGNAEVIEIEVPTAQFTSISTKNKLQKIDLIKIDVEGHEIPVLKNMLPLIEKYRPAILIEIIGDENALILDEMFKKLNYQFISIDEVNQSFVVEKLWDNDHHNFLICDREVIELLRAKELVK